MGDSMIHLTHVKIAEMVLSNISKNAVTYISRSEFIRGSKYPDYDIKNLNISHTFEGSISVVKKLLIKVTTSKLSRYERGFNMGLIAHFLADYMCSYHSNPHYMKKNIFSHIRYEQKLHKAIKHVQTFDSTIFKKTNIDEFIEEIAIFILYSKHSSVISMEDDFNHAVSIVNHMVNIVLDVVVPQELLLDIEEKPQRVAIFSDTYFPQINGVSNTIHLYMRYLDEMHIPYVLISPKYEKNMPDKAKGYDIVDVKSMSFFLYKEARIAIPNQKRLSQILDDFKPTVIHVMTEFFIGYTGLKYGKKRKIPVVTNYSTHFVSHLEYTKLWFFKKPLKKYLRWFHNQANLTTCPSKDTQRYLKSFGIIETSIFGRGIHTEQFSPKYRDDSWRNQFGEHPYIYLYVGRVSSEKELTLALDAFRKMKALYNDICFVVCGDGPKKTAYEKQYPNVHFVGYQTGEMLSKIYASSDIFVFPSPTETLGNVVLEAMASGLPVIVANQGGVLENVVHLQNGMIAANQTVEAYYEHMIAYYKDRNRYQIIQQQALNEVKEKQWVNIFKHQLEMYRLLNKTSRGSL
jgi:glycosyltransferase involved in cell wall biosynthesis